MSVGECLEYVHAIRPTFPDLICTVVHLGDKRPHVRLEGKVRLDHLYRNTRLVEDYEVTIRIEETFPASIPQVSLSGESAYKDYPHAYENGSLCLGVNGEILMILSQADNPLSTFLDGIVMPNLYACEYHRRYGTMPFGDRSHGDEGVIEFYREYFDTDGDAAMRLLRVATGKDRYHRKGKCPCGSGKLTKDCHAEHIDRLRHHVDSNILLTDCHCVTCALGKQEAMAAKDRARRRLRGFRR